MMALWHYRAPRPSSATARRFIAAGQSTTGSTPSRRNRESKEPAIATQLCYAWGMPSVTSSFRMSRELQRELADAAERTGRGKNAIIIEALVQYLKAMERESISVEARRQSELVSRNERDGDWYGLADVSGWR